MADQTQRKPWLFDGTRPGPGRPRGSTNKPKTLAAALNQLTKRLQEPQE